MWERYGFYVIQTLLALYLSQHFQWHDDRTYALVGSFTALTYLSPVIGGWIADKLLGQKTAILFGIVFLFFSFLLLANIDTDIALASSLAGIAVGTGLIKPNISSLLGNEYPPGSPQRESGFTIFYMGIATGIILGTTLPSQLSLYFGWSAAFISASIAMIMAFFVFNYGIMVYKIKDYNPSNHHIKAFLNALFLVAGLWALSFYVLYYPQLANFTFITVVLLSGCYLFHSIRSESYEQARQTLIITFLCIISVIFWAFYFQMFLSFTLFISRVVEPELFGLPFPPPYYVTIQSIGLIFFGYFLSKSKLNLNTVQRSKNIAGKFLSSIILMIIVFIIFALVTTLSDQDSLITPLSILPAYLIISVAELLLSPVGLSAITILARRDKVSTMMGIFFVSLGLGGFLSGKLASLASLTVEPTNIALVKIHYAKAFTQLAALLSLLGVVCLGLYICIRLILRQIIQHQSLEKQKTTD